jgi:hypothetical protein
MEFRLLFLAGDLLWGVIARGGAGVVLVRTLTYRFIEQPALKVAPGVADRIALSPP